MNEFKSIVYNKKSPNWFNQDYTMNIYRGCNHKCIYCDSMSECYGVKNFHTVVAKKNAIEIVYKDLKSKNKKGLIATGAMTDPYNTLEEKYELTRKSLEIIRNFGFGVFITTKSDLVLRDLDILLEIKKHAPVIIGITITSFDDDLSKVIEPNAPSVSKRFEALKTLSQNNIFSGIMLMPVLPFIEDNTENIVSIVNKAIKYNTDFISPYFGVTLRGNQREYFYNELDKSFPSIKEKYISTFRNNYNCLSPNAATLKDVFVNMCKKNNILYKMNDIIVAYKKDYEIIQQKLF